MTTPIRPAAFLCALALCLLFVAGCQSANTGDGANAGMPAAQKDAIARHKEKE